MFHDGDIASGIATARQQSKAVVCFVRDSTDKSLEWEDTLLKEEELAERLKSDAVVLRIEAGSQEAQALSVFSPIQTVPTIVLIKDGTLRECLDAGTEPTELKDRLLGALGGGRRETQNQHVTSSSSTAAETTDQDLQSRNLNDTPPASTNEGVTQEAPAAANAELIENRDSNVEDQLADRRQRLERQRHEQEAAEKAEKAARREVRGAQETNAHNLPSDPKRAQALRYVEEQRKRKQEAQKERERIMRLVENDKLERREKEERRKALARAEAERNAQSINQNGLTDAENSRETSSSSKDCAIQIRLLDGSSIRSRFSREATLESDVRAWIDEHHRSQGGDNTPYTFKQILVPQPNRNISISEEQESLVSLGLHPSATLVLSPVKEYTSAYGSASGSGPPGLLWQGISAGYGYVSAGLGVVGGVIGTLLGWNQANGNAANPGTSGGNSTGSSSATTNASYQAHQSSSTSSAAQSRTIRVKTLRDQERERDDHHQQQFYNGNQLNFEPNANDVDNDDGDEEGKTD